jgi:hypothetical protein
LASDSSIVRRLAAVRSEGDDAMHVSSGASGSNAGFGIVL